MANIDNNHPSEKRYVVGAERSAHQLYTFFIGILPYLDS
jgi:hypothetical protein